MVMNTVHATYTETYDLNTAVNELSILAIHTPQADALKKMFKGFFEQYKKVKVNSCNIAMVCASQQALTPDLLGVGTEGSVDPRDVLNPILFKACTGDNLNVILNQAYNQTEAIIGSSIDQHLDDRVSPTGDNTALEAYYTMLSDDTWRKEHPQRGLVVTGLKPFVHKVVTTQPFKWAGANSTADVPYFEAAANGAAIVHGHAFGGPSASKTGDANPTSPTVFVSNGITEMPWLDTVYQSLKQDLSAEGTPSVLGNYLINRIPRCYCGVIVLPPAINQRLFFRMRISWSISFRDFRPAYECGPVTGGVYDDSTTPLGDSINSYWNLYHNATTLSRSLSSFDANGLAEVDTVMEQVN